MITGSNIHCIRANLWYRLQPLFNRRMDTPSRPSYRLYLHQFIRGDVPATNCRKTAKNGDEPAGTTDLPGDSHSPLSGVNAIASSNRECSPGKPSPPPSYLPTSKTSVPCPKPKIPEELMTWLNPYLSAMTDEVLNHHGIVNKFTGDGIMAAFGVPVPAPPPNKLLKMRKMPSVPP